MRLTDTEFETAVGRYGDTVFRLAYSYLKNRADAEDVMQETLLKLYLHASPSSRRSMNGTGWSGWR